MKNSGFRLSSGGNIPSFPASCRSFISEECSPGHTLFPNQEQGSAGMPMQMAGQDAGLSLAAGMGVLDRSSGSLGSVSYPSYP